MGASGPRAEAYPGHARTFRAMRRAAPLALLVALLTGCGGSGGGSDLADKDAKGAEACAALAQAFENKDDTSKAIEGSKRAGTAAAEASTQAIRDATLDLAGTRVADPQGMVTACRDAGVEMPDVPGS